MDADTKANIQEGSKLTEANDVTVEYALNLEAKRDGCYLKVRHVLAVLCFSAMFNVYAVRSCLSVAIVAMVNSTTHEAKEHQQNLTSECPNRGQNASRGESFSNGIFNWDAAQQGLLLGCFFYGYACNNILGRWMSRRFGFKRVMGLAMMFSGLFTVCIPPAAHSSFGLLVPG